MSNESNFNSYFSFSETLFFWKFHSLGPGNALCILGVAILFLLACLFGAF